MADDKGDWDGEPTITIAEPTQTAEAGRQPADAILVVLSGTRIGELVRVSDGLTIGRSEKAAFRVLDDNVSRIHVELGYTPDGGVSLTDRDSRNGTFVNGERIYSTLLQDGDKVRIGTNTMFKFSFTDAQETSFQEQLYESAICDPLTGLYNRRHMEAQLEAEYAYAMRQEVSVSLLMLDLDHFKPINDTYGHKTGDELLVAFSRLLKETLRTEDLAVRYGGEEFVVVCRGIGSGVAQIVGNRVRRAVEQTQLLEGRPEVKLTISVGVASAPRAGITGPQELLEAADAALYRAKASGRNRVCVDGDE